VPLVWKSGPIGLLLGQIGGYAGELVYASVTSRHEWNKRPQLSLPSLRRAAVAYLMYPLYDVWSTLLRVLAVNGQALLIAWLYGPAAAGYLLLAQRLLASPLSAISFSVSRVFYSDAAILAREAPIELRQLFVSTLQRFTLLSAPPLALVCLAAPIGFTFIFGERWHISSIYCSILCPFILLRILAFVVAPTLDVVNRQGMRLARELICTASIMLGVVLARSLGWSETSAVAVSTALGSLGYLVAIVITWQALAAHLERHTTPVALPRFAKAA
jgi:O-antigen/teichoic acid export membrane protein